MFHSNGDLTITGLQMLTYAWHSWSLNSQIHEFNVLNSSKINIYMYELLPFNCYVGIYHYNVGSD